MSTEIQKTHGLYYQVIDGTFRRKVTEDTQGAVKREYETKDGNKGVKFEMVIDSLEGYIEEANIFDGDFGRSLQLKLDENPNGQNPHIQFSVENTYGEDMLRKLPNVDFSKPVKLRPYAFTNQENGRDVRGVEVSQGETKHKNYFWDFENKKTVNGIPEPEGDKDEYTKDDWKMHFLSVRKFLITHFTDNVRPKMEAAAMEQRSEDRKSTITDTGAEYPQEDIKAEDIPFN